MSKITLSFAVHYSSFMLFLVILTYDLSYLDMPSHHTYGGRLKYLTFISFVCGLIYNNLAAIIDFQIWMRGKDSPLWRHVRDFIFTTMTFPLSTFVCFMFWGITLIDSTALRTAEDVKLVPWWLEHGYHTLPILTAFLQAYVIQHAYPRKKMAFLSASVIDLCYIGWIFWIAYKADIWVYPMFARMSLPSLVVFLAVAVNISFGFYFVGKKFSDIVWDKDKGKAV